ncbi:hypothetical protein QO001_000839 [Methylobacterium brachiatum]|jgi:hypothetical protein|uniref:Uncharacterized protein n=1 Tax=Methylobacterium brachiatum TaxID=269660 RepID=A0AAJ1TJS9_9HYPH|nr:hypothetical protein [Methylobacterium brachiatum]MCB4803495.1 hypothetical protein [Methylobacterium brachiatum]MDQ0541931.1 hypothetical protein [Methylobacterium brachiatum]
MTSLLITTPNYLLRYDTKTRETFVVEDSRREYYGISWFAEEKELYLGHSANKNQFVQSFPDYAASETGHLSRGMEESWRFLSLPHQVLCHGNKVLVTNTGRNCLSVVNKEDWFIRQFHYSSIKWDRYGAGVSIGHHFNSLFYDGKLIYILASNHDANSFVVKIDPNTFDHVETLQSNSSHMHNIWVRDDDTIISCDSMNARLVNFETGAALWECLDRSIITRGLAATTSEIFVGASTRTDRNSRVSGETALWVVSTDDFQTLDYHNIGDLGAVHEIRVIGERDLCHDNGVMPVWDGLNGVPLRSYLSRNKLDALEARAAAIKFWDVKVGDIAIASDTAIQSSGTDLCIALVPGKAERHTRLRATLDVSDPEAAHTSLILRYAGPDDTNMIVAMLRRESALQGRIGIWQHDGSTWTELAGAPFYRLTAEIEFVAEDDQLMVISDGQVILATTCRGSSVLPGRIGVRNLGGAVLGFSPL